MAFTPFAMQSSTTPPTASAGTAMTARSTSPLTSVTFETVRDTLTASAREFTGTTRPVKPPPGWRETSSAPIPPRLRERPPRR